MSAATSGHIDQADRATCLALSNFLHAMGRLALFGLLLTALTVLASSAGTRAGASFVWMLCSALALGLAERVLALRLAFDARLFEALANGGLPTLGLLDQALAAVGLRRASAHSRGLAERVSGTRLLVMQHIAVVALQALLAGALLMPGWSP